MEKIYVLLALGLLLVAGCVGQPGSAGTAAKAIPGAQNAVVAKNVAVANASAVRQAAKNGTASTAAAAQNATQNTNATATPPLPPAQPPSPYGDVKALPESTVGTITIPLSELSTTIRKYSYDINGTTVRFFAVLGSDGKVRTAFDACQVCYRAKKGYSQAGSDVRCNNCGRQFAIDDLGTANTGKGCWPGYLPSSASGGDVEIKVSDLQNGAYLFPS